MTPKPSVRGTGSSSLRQSLGPISFHCTRWAAMVRHLADRRALVFDALMAPCCIEVCKRLCTIPKFCSIAPSREFPHDSGVQISEQNDALVSALHQNLDRQIAALRAEHCDRIFREKASGR